MKTSVIIFVLFSLLGPTASCQKKTEIRQVEFGKMSRGYEERVTIGPDSVHVWVENVRGQKPQVNYSRVTTKDEWTGIVTLVNQLSLKDIEALPSPTMKRASDAAMHANITIRTADSKSYTHGFDDDDPHPKLRNLLTRIREISATR